MQAAWASSPKSVIERGVIALCVALGVAACSPGHTLLKTLDAAHHEQRDQSQSDAIADVVADEAAQMRDTSAPPQDSGGDELSDASTQRNCQLDEECPTGMLCQKVCTACSRVATACPPRSLQTITTVNGCLVLHCEPASCMRSEDCAAGLVCWQNKCVGCDTAPDGSEKPCAAPWTQVPVLRNGCMRYECVPPKGCVKDTDCAAGTVCQAGAHCTPGGEGDTSRCWGNMCGPGSCGGLAALSKAGEYCSAVGCASGLSCETKCSDNGCVCDSSLKQWVCAAQCGHCTTY